MRGATAAVVLAAGDGRFVCGSCSRPANTRPPHGTIETLWSPAAGSTDFGLGDRLPPRCRVCTGWH